MGVTDVEPTELFSVFVVSVAVMWTLLVVQFVTSLAV